MYHNYSQNQKSSVMAGNKKLTKNLEKTKNSEYLVMYNMQNGITVCTRILQKFKQTQRLI